MRLLNSLGPNPRMVRMFMHEKGIEVPNVDVDMLGGENRQPAFTAKNPAGQVPALELDDGSIIGETVAICEYLEEQRPEPALIGKTPEERAGTRMWTRRVEMNITEHMYNGFRYAEGLDLFRDRVVCVPEGADGLKKKGQAGLAWLDGLLGDNDYICGNRLTMADIVLYCCMDFCGSVGQPRDPALKNLENWFARMNARPSADATIAPNWEELGMRV
ncbi:MAG: glutathione S-transferase family protein [Salinisphaera sp.]|nr:glutathione S-transferase family protein [Salinisphaera sp.]